MSAIVRRLGELAPDAVALQEVWTDEARERIIGEARQMTALQHHVFFKTGIWESGLLVLSRFPITEVAFHRFRLGGRPEDIANGEALAGKGVALARLQTPAGEVDLYDFHLIAQYTSDEADPYQAHRAAAALEMVNFVATQSAGGNPVLLMGDLNARPDQRGYHIMACLGGFRDAHLAANPDGAGDTRSGLNPYTPNDRPTRIDYIFSRDGASLGLEIAATRVIMDGPPPPIDGVAPLAYSDHYGVLSEMTLGAGRRTTAPTNGQCPPITEIWDDLLATVERALVDARARRLEFHGKVVGGALAAPALFAAGRAMARSTAAGETEPRSDGVLRRRRFLARLAQLLAVGVVSPYALAHGLLALADAPDEVRELEAFRDAIRRHLGGPGGSP